MDVLITADLQCLEHHLRARSAWLEDPVAGLVDAARSSNSLWSKETLTFRRAHLTADLAAIEE